MQLKTGHIVSGNSNDLTSHDVPENREVTHFPEKTTFFLNFSLRLEKFRSAFDDDTTTGTTLPSKMHRKAQAHGKSEYPLHSTGLEQLSNLILGMLLFVVP